MKDIVSINQYNLKIWAFEPERSGFKSQQHHLLILWPRASYLTALGISFLMCKIVKWGNNSTRLIRMNEKIKTMWSTLCFAFMNSLSNNPYYSKSSTYEPSSCELSKIWTCVPSTSGMSETAACPPSSPIADDPSALPSPTSSPSSSQ